MRRWVCISSPAVALHGRTRTLSSTMKNQRQKKAPSILSNNINSRDNKKFYLETFGCQMNVSDSELVDSILRDAKFKRTEVAEEADVILTNTCAIRDNAERKVWHRLNYFKSLKEKRGSPKNKNYKNLSIGVLGCMAERISTKILEESSASFVCGPDAYRSLPDLIESTSSSSSQKAANIQLSLEETYADIQPVRKASSTEAFVSIMRGCNNMCSYCVVPFTRGRERSRPFTSILDEVKMLSSSGVKEIVLLGQNVNSYHDVSDESKQKFPFTSYATAEGFSNIYKSRNGAGARFADLLDMVSLVNPEMRIRFTSPHPKDFPIEVLQLLHDRPNICSSLHLPAQSGNTTVLSRMRRGYSREAYIELVDRSRSMIPGVSISSDFISGFCGETEEQHFDTISLMKQIRFDQAYMYAYSLREKTNAAYNYQDDVPEQIKQRRLREVIDTFREMAQEKNDAEVVGRVQLCLVDGMAKKSTPEDPVFSARTDSNKRILFPANQVPSLITSSHAFGVDHEGSLSSYISNSRGVPEQIMQGEYVVCMVTEARGHVLRGEAICKTSIQHFEKIKHLDGM